MDRRRLAMVNALGLAVAATMYFSKSPQVFIVAIHALAAGLLTLWLVRNHTARAGLIGAVAAGLWFVAQLPRFFGEAPLSMQIPIGFALLGSTSLTALAFSVLQHRQLPARSRIPNTIQGVQLGIAILGLEWFLIFQKSLEDNFQGLPPLSHGMVLLVGQALTILPLVSSALFFMHSNTQRVSLLWAMLGALGLSIFVIASFDAAIYNTYPVGAVWDLFAIAGISSYSIALATLDERNRREKASVFLPLMPNLLGVLTIFIGVIHASLTGVDFVDLTVIAVVAIVLVISQTYSYLDQRKLLLVISQQESRVRHLVMHDALTGLANRSLFQDRLEHAIAMRKRDSGWISLILINIKGFKEINEEFGHAVGDEILMQFGKRLSTWVRPTDTVARLAGDEFAVLMEADQDAALRIAQRLESELTRPFTLAVSGIDLGVAMGVTSLHPSELSHFSDVEIGEAAVNQADNAMYRAKEDGSTIVVNA